MDFLYPLVAIVGESAAKTIDKANFRKNRINYQQLLLLTFITMTASLLAFVVLTKQHLPSFSLLAVGLMVLIALVSFGGNVFDDLSLKADDLSLREPLVDFEPVLAGLAGYLFFPTERKPIYLLAFLLGAVVVYWGSHRRKLRRVQSKGLLYLFLAGLFYALLPSIYKITLPHISPAYISLFRVASLLLLTTIFLPTGRKLKKLSSKKLGYSFASGVIYSVEAVANLYAIEKLGVVLTMVLLMLGPALRYLTSYFVLKENVRRGEVASSFMLSLIVLVSVLK